MDVNEKDILDKLQAFAGKLGVRLETNGKVGFGRPCVGFTDGSDGNYIDYNPLRFPDYDNVWVPDPRLEAPDGVRAYHKHNCFAVLVHDGKYITALSQLLDWMNHLEAQGKLYLCEYKTGATGIQAMISGKVGYAIRIV